MIHRRTMLKTAALGAVAMPYLASGRLKRVLESACPSFPGLQLYYPSRRQMPAKLRAFIDFYKEKARKRSSPS